MFVCHAEGVNISGEALDKLVPIFVTLKDLVSAANQVSLLEYVNQQTAECGVTSAQIANLFSWGRVLFLLDGLDEVREKDTCIKCLAVRLTAI